MSYEFNSDEIFEIAEQIERNGAKFYRDRADAISDASIRQLFLEFADMEDQHQKVFASLRKDLSDQEKQSTVFDPEGETALYLRALADLRVFDKTAEEDFTLSDELSEQEKERRSFKAAIGREKDSIVFYLGIKELVPKKLGQDKIDVIIKEEMNHLRFLSNKLASSKG